MCPREGTHAETNCCEPPGPQVTLEAGVGPTSPPGNIGAPKPDHWLTVNLPGGLLTDVPFGAQPLRHRA